MKRQKPPVCRCFESRIEPEVRVFRGAVGGALVVPYPDESKMTELVDDGKARETFKRQWSSVSVLPAPSGRESLSLFLPGATRTDARRAPTHTHTNKSIHMTRHRVSDLRRVTQSFSASS